MQNAGLADYATTTISKQDSGGLERLSAAVSAIGGRPPGIAYPYDLSAVVPALPRIPILFLFNDVDEQFPAGHLFYTSGGRRIFWMPNAGLW